MNDFVVITYRGQQVSVPKEVADCMEQDRKREQAQEKQDEWRFWITRAASSSISAMTGV